MIKITDKDTGQFLGEITEDQLQYLVDQLEEEFEGDTDYYFNKDILDVFEERGIEPTLLSFLRRAMGERDEMEIEWTDA
jgi:hypothetical protein